MLLFLLASFLFFDVANVNGACHPVQKWSYPEPGGITLIIYGLRFKSESPNNVPFEVFVHGADGKPILCVSPKAGELKPDGEGFIYAYCPDSIEGKYGSIKAPNGLKNCGEKIEILAVVKQEQVATPPPPPPPPQAHELARGKPTWQLGTGWDGDSKRAVDGNEDGNYGANSCTHTDLRNRPYWAVDFGKSEQVTGVGVYNRVDCCPDRLSHFYVVVTETRPEGDNPVYTNDKICAYRKDTLPPKLNFKCYKPISGRYLMIQLQKSDYLTLCEVKVYGGVVPSPNQFGDAVPVNVAQGKNVWQTGLFEAQRAEFAVDGDERQNYALCTHTDLRDKPYWAVDLGQSYSVAGVSLINRNDCTGCEDRLSNYNVVVTDTRPGDNPTYGYKDICAYRKATHQNTLNLKCHVPINGRYVMIQLQKTEYLTLCEVKVYAGEVTPAFVYGDADWVNANNLAKGKTAWQSSIVPGLAPDGLPQRAVDGNDNADYFGASCSHTNNDKNAWWAVDLGQSQSVIGVSIMNRGDCCGHHLNNYDVVVTDTKPEGLNPAYGPANVCINRPLTHNGNLDLRCAKPITGRYVMIRLMSGNNSPLMLCEVKVYAEQQGPAAMTQCTPVTDAPVISQDDAISVAKCPGNLVVRKCECEPQTAAAFCDGVIVTADAKECQAHGSFNGGSVKARACCGDPAGIYVKSVYDFMLNNGLQIWQKAERYTKNAAVECDNGSELVTCLLHTYWFFDFGKPVATISGRRCAAPPACSCAVQAVCRRL